MSSNAARSAHLLSFPVCFCCSLVVFPRVCALLSSCGSSPYVFECPVYTSEVAVDWFGSGGGFSAIFPRPAYQNAVVSAYLKSSVSFPPAKFFNASNRAIPDVAIYGSVFPIIVGGQFAMPGGTSVSSPLWSGVISLINEISIKYTGTTVGFINPLLYAMQASDPSTFIDITQGNNKNCPNGTCVGPCEGYYTAPGYDAVTGLGSPNWSAAQLHALHRSTVLVCLPSTAWLITVDCCLVLCPQAAHVAVVDELLDQQLGLPRSRLQLQLDRRHR